ncbi:MAG: biotin carboxylase, partial [Bacteroidia bacterium]|nr:biotin carboxylase [Bacteroidia bacterium]
LQIKVARGEKLSIKQEDLSIEGHALELRVYAEDPQNDFLPSVGRLDRYKIPEGKGIRVDDGFEEGMDVPIYYDPMLSKLITYGRNRSEAIDLMIKAIDDYHIEGVETTLPFGKFVCQHEAFRSGNFDTHFVQSYYSKEKLQQMESGDRRLAALIGLYAYLEDRKKLRIPN